MSTSKHLRLAILALLAVLTMGGRMLAWPSYRDAAGLDQKADMLYRKGETHEYQLEMIQELTEQLHEVTRRVETEFKVIPEAPDVAGLIRVLSLPVDGVNLRDQTFTTGQPRNAAQGADVPGQAMPLTVDMVARFDAVFALIRTTELMDRLLRIASLNLVSEGQLLSDGAFVRASVGLEAIYDPPLIEEGR